LKSPLFMTVQLFLNADGNYRRLRDEEHSAAGKNLAFLSESIVSLLFDTRSFAVKPTPSQPSIPDMGFLITKSYVCTWR
jgi:hypothetical protein